MAPRDRSTELGDTSSADTSHELARRRRRRSEGPERLDYPRSADIDTQSDDSDRSNDSEDSEESQQGRRGHVGTGAGRSGNKGPGESRTMHSFSKWTGVQRTQMKHLLSPEKTPEPSWTSALVTPPAIIGGGGAEKERPDSESQPTTAELNFQENERALSWKRRLYIGGTIILCVLLVVVGIILGLRAVRQREAAAEKGFSPELAADHALLVAGGERVQSQLEGGSSIDHSRDEVHRIAEYDREATHENNEDELDESDKVDLEITHESDDILDSSAMAIPVASPAPAPNLPSASSSHRVVVSTDPALVHESFPILQSLFDGNSRFINETNSDSPGLLKALGLGQTPHFATLGCSDSRVSETLVLGAQVGDLFVTRNIGNQYLIDSLSTESVFSYAISHLGVSHLIVMGHTKCGAVLAAIVPESQDNMSDIGENRIMTWIRPIRSLYSTSTRPEIVSFRETASKQKKETTSETVTSDVWNALVEENVKRQVRQLSTDPSVLKSWKLWGEGQQGAKENSSTAVGASNEHEKRSSDSSEGGAGEEEELVELWIHGWVYDVDTGLVHDLGVSVGPRLK